MASEHLAFHFLIVAGKLMAVNQQQVLLLPDCGCTHLDLKLFCLSKDPAQKEAVGHYPQSRLSRALFKLGSDGNSLSYKSLVKQSFGAS